MGDLRLLKVVGPWMNLLVNRSGLWPLSPVGCLAL